MLAKRSNLHSGRLCQRPPASVGCAGGAERLPPARPGPTSEWRFISRARAEAESGPGCLARVWPGQVNAILLAQGTATVGVGAAR